MATANVQLSVGASIDIYVYWSVPRWLALIENEGTVTCTEIDGNHLFNSIQKGGGATVTALLAGEVHLSFTGAVAVKPYIKSGRLRAIAVTSAQPFALVPGVPTVAASRLPGYESQVTSGLFAPAKTPMPIANRLNQEVVRFLSAADVKEQLLSAGVEAAPSSPQQFEVAIKSETERLRKIIRNAGIQQE